MSVFHCDITIFRFIYLFLNLSIHVLYFVSIFVLLFFGVGGGVLKLSATFIHFFYPFHLFYFTLFFL